MFWRSLAQIPAVRLSKLTVVRPSRLAFPLAVLLSLLLAAPAGAFFDWQVNTTSNYTFSPGKNQISVGDSVTWHFNGPVLHTATSLSGQPDSWDSQDEGAGAAGTTFTHTFAKPGRYQYVCIPHRQFMKGVITVGTYTVADTVTRFRTRKLGHRVRISYVLKEPAIVRYRLRGPSPRRVKKGHQPAGAHSFTVRHLRTGTYHGTLTAVDDFDKKNISKKSFVIG
jgi:plastocyanin